jgi:pimeloyl-ACP methyl ester carboxylesterase
MGSIIKRRLVNDDQLIRFEAEGAAPLPDTARQGYVQSNGAQIWYSVFGTGPTLVLLHGGFGNSGNWGYQAPVLVEHGYRVIVVDSRGHGRSTRTQEPYSYELMSFDVLAVMDLLQVDRAVLVGWSDGACVALILGHRHATRVQGVVFFACNMDPSGTKPFEPSPIIERCLRRHRTDYARLSATPGDFKNFFEAVGQMQRTQPNYTAADLGGIAVPVLILHAEQDEFISREHAEYLHANIPGSAFEVLANVSHFAPIQRPMQFSASVLAFADRIANTQGGLSAKVGVQLRRRGLRARAVRLHSAGGVRWRYSFSVTMASSTTLLHLASSLP